MEQESNLSNGYFDAFRIACDRLAKANIEEVCQNSKAEYDKKNNTYSIEYFGMKYIIDCISGAVKGENPSDEVTVTEKVLILHYLVNSKPRPLTGRSISFMEVPGGGAIYYSTFKKRAIDPLVKVFSNNIKGFERASISLYGCREKFGTVSYTINVFPMVPVTYVLWVGDEEVSSSGAILFDASIINFLPVEDIVLAASFGSYKLIGQSNS